MSNSNQCLPPRGQLFQFPPTGGPLLLLGEGQLTRRQYMNRCGGPCAAPRVPQGTVVFFSPPKVAPPYRPPMPPSPPSPPRPPPTVMYGNTEQECTNTCPLGTNGAPITVTVGTGVFERTDQAAANAAALASACAQADALRAATPCTVEGELVVTMESDTRDCSLCGFEAFHSPSLPPAKYKTVTYAGTDVGVVYNVVNTYFTIPYSCAEVDGAFIQGNFAITYTGSATYDENCVIFTSIVQTIVVDGGAPIIVDPFAYGPTLLTTTCLDLVTLSPTVQTKSGLGTCCGTASTDLGKPALSQIHSGGHTQTLSNPDTEELAILRATPVLGTLNVAKYQQRTTGFDFVYQTVAIDFDLNTLVTGVDYRITLPITTENYGGGSPVVTETYYDFTAPGPTHNISDLIVAVAGKQVTIGTAVLSAI